MPPKRKKTEASKWSEEMKLKLLEYAIKYKSELFGCFTAGRTAKTKNDHWNEIHEELVKMGYDGTVSKLRNQHFNNLVSRTKKKLDFASHTGNGKPEDLDEIDELVLQTKDPSCFYKNGVQDPMVAFGPKSIATTTTTTTIIGETPEAATKKAATTAAEATTEMSANFDITPPSPIDDSEIRYERRTRRRIFSFPLSDESDTDDPFATDLATMATTSTTPTISTATTTATTATTATTSTTSTITTTLSSELGIRRRKKTKNFGTNVAFDEFLEEYNGQNNNVIDFKKRKHELELQLLEEKLQNKKEMNRRIKLENDMLEVDLLYQRERFKNFQNENNNNNNNNDNH